MEAGLPESASTAPQTATAAVVVFLFLAEASPCLGAASAPGPRGQPASAPSALRGEWAILAKEAGLSREQRARLEALVLSFQEKAAAWEKENGPKWKAAREAKDANVLSALRADQAKLNADREKELNSLLRDDQRLQWEGFKLYRTERTALHRLKLTDEQKAKIREQCDAAAHETLPLKEEKDLRAAKARLRERSLDVLTYEQREAMRKSSETEPAPRGGT